MGKNFSTIQNFIMNSEDLTLKQMFDVTRAIRRLSLIGDETVINLQRTKVYVLLRFCVVPREDPSTSRFQRSLEEQNCRGHDREKPQRL